MAMPKRSQRDMLETRQLILRKALDLASVEGLEGVTIGRLGDAVSMSKSGLFAHFGSKEDLQMAIVEAAADAFDREVLAHIPAAEVGLQRLTHFATSWLRYLERGPFRGGCFFSAIAAEVDDRPGRIRDRVIALTGGWVDILEKEAAAAQDAGELDPAADPAQLAFEIHAFVQEANWAFQLHGDAQAFRRASRAIRRSIDAATTRN